MNLNVSGKQYYAQKIFFLDLKNPTEQKCPGS